MAAVTLNVVCCPRCIWIIEQVLEGSTPNLIFLAANVIDAEARKLVHEAFRKTENLVRDHRRFLDALSSQLLEKEVLTSADVEALIGPCPFPQKQKVRF